MALGAKLSDRPSPISVLYYGPEGTGKTSAAALMTRLCTGKQKVLIIDAEGGLKAEALEQRGVDLDKIEVWPEDGDASQVTYENLKELAEGLRSAGNKKYAGVVWDSGTEISKRVLGEYVRRAEKRDQKLNKNRADFQINLEDHGVASSAYRDLLRLFRDLPMHFVITALERRDVDTDTGKVKYGPNMSPAMANDTAGLMDIVAYCGIEYPVEENPDFEVFTGFFKATKTRRAKDRYSMLPPRLADPAFDRIEGYIKGRIEFKSDPVQAAVRAAVNGETPKKVKPVKTTKIKNKKEED